MLERCPFDRWIGPEPERFQSTALPNESKAKVLSALAAFPVSATEAEVAAYLDVELSPGVVKGVFTRLKRARFPLIEQVSAVFVFPANKAKTWRVSPVGRYWLQEYESQNGVFDDATT